MPEHLHEVAVTYNNLTALYNAAGDKKQAMLCLQRALQAFEKCADEENVHYAAGLNSLAAFLYAEGGLRACTCTLTASMRYTLRFFGRTWSMVSPGRIWPTFMRRWGRGQRRRSA